MIKIYPSKDDFLKLSKEYNLIPIYTEILADIDTPLSIFFKLRKDGKRNVLLESAEGGEKWGRYSFFCQGSQITYQTKDNFCLIKDGSKIFIKETSDPIGDLSLVLNRFKPYIDPNLPRFFGGFVGYISYDVVKFYNPIASSKPDELGLFDIDFFFTETLVIYDNLKATIKIILPTFIRENDDLSSLYDEKVNSLESIVKNLKESSFSSMLIIDEEKIDEDLKRFWESNFKKEEFIKAIEQAKKYVEEGDIIQVVPSQRFKKPFNADPFSLYRVLRYLNPSPYMYLVDYGDLYIIGSSPEMLVRVENSIIETHPIAGTRKRGKTLEEDRQIEKELLSDEKERAEHLMLVDLARNDVGKVSEKASVKVEDFMHIEKFSHVIHMVSNVFGKKKENVSNLDVIKALFPAGTLSGAPKVRAMQIIEELEPSKRGPYGGAIGYIGLNDNMDMAIVLRTAIISSGYIYVQAGMGVVYDSDPEKEYLESITKASHLFKAVYLLESKTKVVS